MPKRSSFFIYHLILVFLLAPIIVFAEIPPSSIDTTRDRFGVNDLVRITVNLVNWFSWFVAVAAVVMGLYSGFLFLTSRGDPAQLTKARGTLFYAIIGIAVAILSFSIITITKSFLNL